MNTGIADHSADAFGMELYPNPAKEILHVEFMTDIFSIKAAKIELYDVYGKLLDVTNVETDRLPSEVRIDVSHLASGMYFVRLSSAAGMVTKPFVKE